MVHLSYVRWKTGSDHTCRWIYWYEKSAKLTKTELTSEEGICQDVHLSAGTYTLSAYVKTESLNPENQEQGAVVSVIRADRTRIMGERCIDYVTDKNVDDGWERLVLTFQLPAEETISVFVGMTRARGTLLVSGVQLETGNVANELNLIDNPGFERCTNDVPDNWGFHAAATGNKSMITADKGRCAVLNGQMEQQLHLSQAVNISGQEGDIFNLSCWVNGFEFRISNFQWMQQSFIRMVQLNGINYSVIPILRDGSLSATPSVQTIKMKGRRKHTRRSMCI